MLVFGKLFKSKDVPQKDGETSSSTRPSKLHSVKVISLELTNMEESPVYPLTNQLTVGSEVGNIIVADPSVSPRHATFFLQDDVVSLIDHGSKIGTLVNGKKIPTGKTIILEESDLVLVGDLEIRIKTSYQAPEKAEAEVEEVVEEIKLKEPPKKKAAPQKSSKANPSAKKTKSNVREMTSFAIVSKHSANSLIRVMAVICDSLLAYTFLVILHPFDEFREFLNFIPETLADLLDIKWSVLWQTVTEDLAPVRPYIEDIFRFLSETFNILPLYLTFIIIRFVTTLLLGVSVSELVLGIRADGNRIWVRIGGGIRVLIDAIIGPFLIFDLPSIVSRRTFKEFITFTNIQTSSKFLAILGTIFFLPLFIALALMAPLVQGLELPEAIMVNDRIDQRVRAVRAMPAKEGDEAVAEAPKDATVTEGANSLVAEDEKILVSKFLNLELPYLPSEVSIIPEFMFLGKENKLSIKTNLIFYNLELKRPVSVELLKNFDLKQLLGIGMRGNFFLYDKFPQINTFVYSSSETHPSLKGKGVKNHDLFANEAMAFTKMSLELTANNLLEVVQENTPMIKGLVDFKHSLLSLIEYKDFDEIGFIKLGNVVFMKVSYSKQKPFDLLIPLVPGEGKLFKVEFDKKQELKDLTNKFYKFNLSKANWLTPTAQTVGETMTPFQVVDFFNSLFKDENLDISAEKAQALYGYYFEKSSQVLARKDELEHQLWQKSVASVHKLAQKLLSVATEGSDQTTVQKLSQNFGELLNAVETKNSEYFGNQNTTTI